MKKLDYKSKKWDKDLKKLEDFVSKYGEFAEIHNLRVLGDSAILQNKRIYFNFLEHCVLTYHNIAGNYYIMNNLDYRAVDYTYLSGLCGIMADKNGEIKDDNKYVFKQISEIEFALYEMIAINQAEKDFFKDKDSVIYNIFCGDYEKAEYLLQSVTMDDSTEEGSLYDTIEHLKAIYMAIIARDEELFNEELAKRIRKYRKNMVGYFPRIDVISVALIKMAQKAGINYNLNVIEIPEIFIDESYQIDKDKMKPPFYDEAMEKWKIKKEW